MVNITKQELSEFQLTKINKQMSSKVRKDTLEFLNELPEKDFKAVMKSISNIYDILTPRMIQLKDVLIIMYEDKEYNYSTEALAIAEKVSKPLLEEDKKKWQEKQKKWTYRRNK